MLKHKGVSFMFLKLDGMMLMQNCHEQAEKIQIVEEGCGKNDIRRFFSVYLVIYLDISFYVIFCCVLCT